MIVKTKNFEKNTKALDDKSSAFFISKECYDKIMSIDFYRFDKKTGEEIIEKELNYRALCLVYDLNIPNKENHKNENNSKFFGRNTLREYSYVYYIEILNKLSENDVIKIKQDFEFSTRELWVNPEYLSKEYFKIPDSEYYIVVKKIKAKKKNRGNKLNSDGVHIDISRDDFLEIFKNEKDYEKEKYEKLYKNVTEINLTGNLNATQKYMNRCYSLFSVLPSEIHEKTTINGRKLSEIDGHCTFFSFLPAVIDQEIKKITNKNPNEKRLQFLDELIKDNAKLRQIIDETNDVYSLFVDENHDRNMIKKSFNAYLNDRNFNFMYKSIRKWFKENCPKVNTILRQMATSNSFFYKIQQIESQVYGTVAKNMKSSKLPVILKHDCILTYREYIETAKEMLLDVMIKLNISQKMKQKHYETYDFCSLRSQMATLSFNFSTFKDPSVQSSNIDLYIDNSLEQAFVDDCTDDFGFSGTKSLDDCDSIGTKTISITTLKDGRYRVSIKNVKYNSKKNETKGEFYERMMKITGFTQKKTERSDFVREPSEIKLLTKEQEFVILEKPVEAVSGGDEKKTDSDTKKTEKRPGRACGGNSDKGYDIEMFNRMINGEIDV